ncbi:MAG: endonuclease/exonuclease/phosphatase family protein [Hyphomonas sp.]
MRVVNWNIERHAPHTWQAVSLMEEIAELTPDVICLTEAWRQSTEAFGGFSVSASGVAWSDQHPDEQKVLLWSHHPWREVRVVDELEITGSAVTAKTLFGGVETRFVGICIPYHFANPLGQEPRAKPWSQHERFLQDLRPLLAHWRNEGPVIVIGDFNRRVPRSWGPKRSYAMLESALREFEIPTSGIIKEVDDLTIDHIAFSGNFKVSRIIGRPAEAADGRRRSDHFGIVVDFQSQ